MEKLLQMINLRGVITSSISGMLLALLLAPQGYLIEISSNLGITFPSGLGALAGMLTCMLAMLLFPTIGIVYGYIDRANDIGLLKKISGASIASYIVVVFQIIIGSMMANFLNIDRSYDSQMLQEVYTDIFGPTLLLILILLVGIPTALIAISFMTSIGVILFESIVSKRE
ncbi:MAG: hypothetical protein ACERKX_13940 [Anaerolineales bacterium]